MSKSTTRSPLLTTTATTTTTPATRARATEPATPSMSPAHRSKVVSLSAATLEGRRRHQRAAKSINSSSASIRMGSIRLVTLVACSICLVALLMPAKRVECGRLQEFIQNLVGGGSSSSSSNSNSNKNNNNNNNNDNSNSNSNSNSDNSNDSDTAASNDSNEQPGSLTPMMSAMNPFMRYPSFYDSFGPAGFGAGGYPGMSFSGPMASAMSAMSPMAALSTSSMGTGHFSPASFSPASFGSYGSASAGSSNPLSAFTGGATGGMSASTLNNVYASSPGNAFMSGYTPYYGRKR